MAFVTFQYPLLHGALARVLAGTGDAKIGIIGDSTTYGRGGVGGVGPCLGIVNMLNAAGIPAATGMVIPQVSGGTWPDSRWNVGTGWSQLAGTTGFGSSNSLYKGVPGAGANTLTFTPSADYAYDTFTVYYVQSSGTLKVSIDGGTPVTTAGHGGNAGVFSVTVSGSASNSHVLGVGSVTTGNCFVLGVEPSLSSVPRLRIGNLGCSGSATADWAAGSTNGSIACIQSYAADVWLICLGINDAGNSVTTATYLANLATIITACKNTASDVIICSPIPSGESVHITNETAYCAALPQFAAAHGCAYADIWNAMGGPNAYATLNPLGYYNDTLHPSLTGYALVSQLYYAAIQYFANLTVYTSPAPTYELGQALSVKAGTPVGSGSVYAANVLASTTGRPTVEALNILAGNSTKNYRELAGVLNQLAGTSNLEAAAAASHYAGR